MYLYDSRLGLQAQVTVSLRLVRIPTAGTRGLQSRDGAGRNPKIVSSLTVKTGQRYRFGSLLTFAINVYYKSAAIRYHVGDGNRLARSVRFSGKLELLCVPSIIKGLGKVFHMEICSCHCMAIC